MSHPLLKSLLLIVVAACFAFNSGCEQQRYRPSAWRPATGDGNTLPGIEATQTGTVPVRGSLPSRYGSLPSRGGTLPMRTGTLPMRGNTLPQRLLAAPGNKKVKPPLPTVNVTVWDTSAKEDMPPPTRTPEFSFGMMPGAGTSNSTLPNRSGFNYRNGFRGTLPIRGGSTLPSRGYGRGNTLPNR